MLGAFRKNKFFAWAMMGILVAAMAGFGLGGVLSGGLVTTVASVGDQDIEVDEFVSAFRDRQSVITQQLGRPISTIEARSVGLDQVVLQELIRGATLEGEALEQGIGVSDRIVQAELLRQPGFQDLSGGFDREMYEFALQNAGLTASQYDAQLRSQAQQQLLATAIAEGASVGTAAANAILAFTGERRGVSTLTLPAIAFLDEVGEPSTADLQAHLSDFEAQFERPETREVSYAVLDPEQVAATMPISDDEVIAAYEADVDRFITPERRIVDRISFPDEAAAEAGRAALEDGSLTTVQIAQERGLQPQDLSLGLVTATDLTRAEREVVFGDTGVGIVGPVATDLGPAVFV
ncbi:MAG: peptidylprolyl isomerase, partial [Pseudomonadota bacterium]